MAPRLMRERPPVHADGGVAGAGHDSESPASAHGGCDATATAGAANGATRRLATAAATHGSSDCYGIGDRLPLGLEEN